MSMHHHAAGEKVTVVAIGGSVTTGMGARNLSDAYPYRIAQWLRTLGSGEHPAQVEVRTLLTADWCLTEVLNPKQSVVDLASCKSLLPVCLFGNSISEIPILWLPAVLSMRR